MTDSHTAGFAARTVRVESPARLHLGFMDLNGALGRQYGSLGLTIEGLGTRVSASVAHQADAVGPSAARALACVNAMSRHLGRLLPARIVVEQAIPEHAGLGSGTQLGLAVGTALSHLFGLKLSARDLADMLDRGARSGIGLGAFEQGGFLVDGGRSADPGAPRITVRLAFPEHWRALLIFDSSQRGLHGEHEVRAFKELPLFPAEAAARLCRLTLMRILPALVDGAYTEFGLGISELQRVVGDHYAGAQGGRYTSVRVARVLSWMEAQGVPGVGQSSWGPTGFAIIESEERAAQLLGDMRERFREESTLSFEIYSARNRGATIDVADGADTLRVVTHPARK